MAGTALADTTPAPAGYVALATTSTQTNVATTAADPDLTGLSNGDNVHIDITGPAGSFFGMDVRQCADTADITFNSDFVPDGGNCIDVPFNASSDSVKVKSAAPTNTNAFLDFRVGTGTRTFFANDIGATVTITCDDTHPCDLWIKEAVPASINGGINWVHYDMTFAAPATAPGAPTGVTATPGDAAGTISWTAPASTGNRPLDQYTVTLTSSGAPITQNVTPPATTANFTGLTNSTVYSATVTARNTAALTGPASSPAVTFTPVPAPPPAPTNLSVTPGDAKADLSWSAPASGATPGAYQVVATPTSPVGADISQTTATNATTYSFTGLTNGSAYTFKVAAVYGGTPGAFSASSSPVTISADGGSVTQTVTVVRPRGALVLTQICGARGAITTGTAPTLGNTPGGIPDPAYTPVAGGTGYPYPTDADGNSIANYPTNCSVNMGTAKKIPAGSAGSGQFLQATGFINQVTVVDERDNDPGWNLTGTMSDFIAGVNTFSGSQMGWHPIKTSAVGPGVNADGSPYTPNVTAGPDVAPSSTPGTGGLKTGPTLASATAAGGFVTAALDADLTLWVPVKAKSGTYVGTLTITLA